MFASRIWRIVSRIGFRNHEVGIGNKFTHDTARVIDLPSTDDRTRGHVLMRLEMTIDLVYPASAIFPGFRNRAGRRFTTQNRLFSHVSKGSACWITEPYHMRANTPRSLRPIESLARAPTSEPQCRPRIRFRRQETLSDTARATVNRNHPESADEENDAGARVTLERSGRTAPFAITCGIYGWMAHTHFLGTEVEARAAFQAIKAELGRMLDLIPQNDDPDRNAKSRTIIDQLSIFVNRYS